MTSDDVPWTLKGVSEDIRTAAREAAEQTGQTVGEWLSGMIRTVEAQERLEIQSRDREARAAGGDEALRAELLRLGQRLDQVEHKTEAAFNQILQRLDDLNGRLGDDGSSTP